MRFKDKLKLTSGKKNKRTVVSIRDGVMEYLGVELGMTPPDKTFKIYRSPETVRKIAASLINLPLADEHIDFDVVPENLIKGKILTSEVKDFKDDATKSSVFVENSIFLDDNMVQLVQDGKDELSLDYSGDLIPHDEYDFEQIDIVPKFLAIVTSGRCGEQCNFKDEKGVLPMEEILKMIKELSDEDRTKLISNLAPVKKDTEDADKEKAMEEAKDAAKEEGIKEGAEKFKDSQCFKDAMMKFADERASVITKASKYLDEKYDFKDKSNDVIMKDVLAAEKSGIAFKDNEVGVAFKMLDDNKATNEHKDFADSGKEDMWSKLKKEEL